MEKYTWEAWIGQRVVQCYSLEDGSVYIELQDGRAVIFSQPQAFLAVRKTPTHRTAIAN